MEGIHNQNNLKKMQAIQFEILQEFDRICSLNDIKYQLCAGTLLGAVRHHGFIPWDDDLDVSMLRKDYDKFISITKKELKPQYFMQTHESKKDYVHAFCRLCKNNTQAVQNTYSEIDMHHGIFIDVFPMDNIELDTFEGKVHFSLLTNFRRLKRLKIRKLASASRNPLVKTIKMSVYFILKPISMQRMNNLESKIIRMFEKKDTDLSSVITIGDKAFFKRFSMRNDAFYDTVLMNFEGGTFPVPRNYHEVLTSKYGDYMEYPPEKDRIGNHDIIELLFD